MCVAALAGDPFLFIDIYTVKEIARFTKKNTSTVKRWFQNAPGVLKYPRGAGDQEPTYGITEPAVRALLKKIGFADADVETHLILPHRQQVAMERAVAEGTGEAPRRKPAKPIKKAENRGRRR